MDDDKAGAAQGRIVECRFEQQRIGSGGLVVRAGSLEGVNVHRQADASGLASDVSEDEILQDLVIVVRRFPAAGEAGVDAACPVARRGGEVERSQVRRLEFDRHRARLPLALERRCDYCAEVAVQRGRQLRDVKVVEISAEQLVLERIQLHAFGRDGRFGSRRQRQHQRIGERNPGKTRWRQARSHRDAIREHRFGADAIEHPGGKVIALFTDGSLHGGPQLGHVGFTQVIVLISVEGFCGLSPLPILRPDGGRQLKRRQDLERQGV